MSTNPVPPSFVSATNSIGGGAQKGEKETFLALRPPHIEEQKVYSSPQAVKDASSNPNKLWKEVPLPISVGGMRSGLSLVKELGTGRSWPSSSSVQNTKHIISPTQIRHRSCLRPTIPRSTVPLAHKTVVNPCHQYFYSLSKTQGPRAFQHLTSLPKESPFTLPPMKPTYTQMVTQMATSNLSVVPVANVQTHERFTLYTNDGEVVLGGPPRSVSQL